MQVGCGLTTKEIRGRPYLYFWHYEDRGGRREQIEEYVGPARSARSRQEVERRVVAYVERAQGELAGFVRATRAALALA